MINYTEFLTACIPVEAYLTDEKIDMLFGQVDINNDGKITKQEIYDTFTRYSKKLTK